MTADVMPAVFFGHGNPMNALEVNLELGRKLAPLRERGAAGAGGSPQPPGDLPADASNI
jgi:hypothetical protein